MTKGLLLAALTFLTVTSGLGGQPMNPRIIDNDAFRVIGISARTSSRKEFTADGVIGPAWARYFQESLLTKIPYKADPNIVAVYADYAIDHNGEYTYVLDGCVTSDAQVPPATRRICKWRSTWGLSNARNRAETTSL